MLNSGRQRRGKRPYCVVYRLGGAIDYWHFLERRVGDCVIKLLEMHPTAEVLRVY